LLLGVGSGICGEWSASAQRQEDFAEIPRVELPAKAASLVQSAKLSERWEVMLRVVKAAGRVSPAIVPAVVGALSKNTPEIAALAAGEAAREQPAQACAIATAAAAEAPAQTKAIVLAVCRAVPRDSRRVALSVEYAVPGSGAQIREALADVVPGMRNGSLINSEPVYANTFKPTFLAPTMVRMAVKPELVRSGVRTASRDPLTRGPIIGPPFVPLSGTVTNVTPSTSGTVPTGGRNYARP